MLIIQSKITETLPDGDRAQAAVVDTEWQEADVAVSDVAPGVHAVDAVVVVSYIAFCSHLCMSSTQQ